MNKTLLWLAVVATVLCLATSIPEVESESEQELKVGGWKNIGLANYPVYEGVIKYLKKEANLLPTGARLVKAESQVVAGTNFRLRFQIGASVSEIVVWQQLDGSYEVTSNEIVSKQ